MEYGMMEKWNTIGAGIGKAHGSGFNYARAFAIWTLESICKATLFYTRNEP